MGYKLPLLTARLWSLLINTEYKLWQTVFKSWKGKYFYHTHIVALIQLTQQFNIVLLVILILFIVAVVITRVKQPFCLI